jgi:toxin ParE1/3/4
MEFRPEVEDDVADAAAWYEARERGLGGDFLREIVKVWERIEFDPWTGAMGGLRSPVRWLYPDRFPYRVIYKIDAAGKAILVIAVLHAARHSRNWMRRDGSRD